MLNFEKKAQPLSADDFNFNAINFYIDKFIASGAITMIYSPANHGKTWLHYAIVKKIVQDKSKEVYYFDRDNGLRTLKQRELQRHLSIHVNWKYYTSSKLNMDTDELLRALDKDTHSMSFKNKVLVFDSTRDFVDDLNNDRQVKHFMEVMKRIRDNGGTILLVHHTTKNGKVFDGSADFEKSADNIFFLTQKSKMDGILQFWLEVKKQRDPTVDLGFSVNTQTLELGEIDPVLASMGEKEEEFVKNAKKALKNSKGLIQKELLQACGLESDSKFGKDCLKNYEDKFWKKQKIGNKSLYLPLLNGDFKGFDSEKVEEVEKVG